MPLSGPQLADGVEVHAIAVKRLENAAKVDIDTAYAKLASRATPDRMARVFGALAQTAEAVISKYGNRAIQEAKRYTQEAYGIVGKPSPTDLAAPVEEAAALIQEHARHTGAVLEIRTKRMIASGVARETIATVVQQDFRHGGRTFSPYRTGVKTAVASAIQGLAQAQAVSAFKPVTAESQQEGSRAVAS